MTIPPVPSDTDRLAEVAPLTDEQVARFAELIDMHRQYGPALSIEGEAQLLVEVLRLRALVGNMRANLVQTAVELHQFWQFAILKEGEGPGWTPDVTAREEGKFRGAAWSLQGFLVTLGQADEEDDEAGAAYEAIEARLAELKAEGVL